MKFNADHHPILRRSQKPHMHQWPQGFPQSREELRQRSRQVVKMCKKTQNTKTKQKHKNRQKRGSGKH